MCVGNLQSNQHCLHNLLDLLTKAVDVEKSYIRIKFLTYLLAAA